MRVLLQRCTFLDQNGALLGHFPALHTNGQRTSRPRQARPRAGRFPARGRARRAPHFNLAFTMRPEIKFSINQNISRTHKNNFSFNNCFRFKMFFKSKKAEPIKQETSTTQDLAIITQMNQEFATSLDLSETLQTALEVIIKRIKLPIYKL